VSKSLPIDFFYSEIVDALLQIIYNRKGKFVEEYILWIYDDLTDDQFFNFRYCHDKEYEEINNVFGECFVNELGEPLISVYSYGKFDDIPKFEFANVLAHELHHLAQTGEFVISKDNALKRAIEKGNYRNYNFKLNYFNYFTRVSERESFYVGFVAESYYGGGSIEECMRRYLKNYILKKIISEEESEGIIRVWKRALN